MSKSYYLLFKIMALGFYYFSIRAFNLKAPIDTLHCL